MSRDLTDALSKLFIKLGGKLSDSKENKGPVDYIDDITDIVEPGGGDSGVCIVTFTYNDNNEFVTDKTFNEVLSAHNNGAIVIFRILSDDVNCNDAIADYWHDNENDIDYFESINFSAQLNEEEAMAYLVPDHISWSSTGIIKETTGQINIDT